MALDTRALRALGWCDPPSQIKLVPGEVQLWLIRVPQAIAEIDHLIARLTPGERERAKAKRITKKRHEYIAGQASLRTLLARQLDIDPMQVKYERGPKGKPYLSETAHTDSPRVQFNISHSGAMVMVAMTLDAELGVDVEWHNERTDPDRVARRAFCEAERHVMSALAPSAKREHFFALWTCKEALVKCTGLGIHSGMNNFEIVLDQAGCAHVNAAWATQIGVDRLHVMPLMLGSGDSQVHAGALVHEPPALTARHWILDASPDPLGVI